MRGVRYWELILKRLSHLGLNVFSAIHGMPAIWNVHYWEVSLYNTNRNNVIKSLIICATQFAGDLLLKIRKYVKIMLKIFEFSHVKEIVES